MKTNIERFGSYVVIAVFFTSLGGFLGSEFVAQGYEDQLALSYMGHTENILRSLNYFRDGNMEYGYRILEMSLDSGRHFTEATANNSSDELVNVTVPDLLRNVQTYQDTYPVPD